jgi:hypothetical protein
VVLLLLSLLLLLLLLGVELLMKQFELLNRIWLGVKIHLD